MEKFVLIPISQYHRLINKNKSSADSGKLHNQPTVLSHAANLEESRNEEQQKISGGSGHTAVKPPPGIPPTAIDSDNSDTSEHVKKWSDLWQAI